MSCQAGLFQVDLPAAIAVEAWSINSYRSFDELCRITAFKAAGVVTYCPFNNARPHHFDVLTAATPCMSAKLRAQSQRLPPSIKRWLSIRYRGDKKNVV